MKHLLFSIHYTILCPKRVHNPEPNIQGYKFFLSRKNTLLMVLN